MYGGEARERRDKLMYEPLKFKPIQSQPRQEPAGHKPTMEDLCDRFEGIVFAYWLLGLCTQGAVIWLLVNIAKAI